MGLPLRIDKDSGIPVYIQLGERIRLLVREGRLRPGDPLPTVRSLAVDQRFGRMGLGTALVSRLIDEAADRGLNRVMALTYVPEFFHTLGFQTVPKATLPEKVWGICVKCYKFYNCDEIAVLRYL